MLKLQKLTKKFWANGKEFKAVDDLSLQVSKGTVLGFIGLNGAGKTTTIKMITGLLFADNGTAKWLGRDTNRIESKKKFGFMPEQPQFYLHLNAVEILTYVGELNGLEHEKSKRISSKLLKKVGLSSSETVQVKNLSKGMRQRLGFAITLVNDPELLILDEPLDGLDPIGRAEFKKLILEQKKAGKTIFLSSHILSDINEICDQIAVIDKGKLKFTGTPKQLTKNKSSLEKAFISLISK